MLYDGPWANCIVAFELGTAAMFERYLSACCQHYGRHDQKLGKLPALASEPKSRFPHARRPDGAIGVQVGGQIQAVALYSLCGTASDKRIMKLFISVAKDYRRQGMATALLMRCSAIAQHAGLRYLVHEDVDADALRFVRLASAELTFCDGDCQAWIELGPLPPAPARTVLAGIQQS